MHASRACENLNRDLLVAEDTKSFLITSFFWSSLVKKGGGPGARCTGKDVSRH